MVLRTERDQETERQALTPEDVLRQAQIQDVTLSPDGKRIIYSRRIIEGNRYLNHLWAIPWSGGDARQLTFGTVKDVEPVFSPDGQQIAFISDRGGRKQPWVMPLDGGEPRRVADLPGETSAVWWSPDASRLLAVASSGFDRLTVGDPDDPTARVIDDFHWRLDVEGYLNQLPSAWVMPLDGGEAVRVTDPEWAVLDAHWMPDGDHIAVVADAEPDAGMRRRSEQAAAWKLRADGTGEPQRIARLPGGVTAVRPGPAGTPVAVIGHDHPRQPSWSDNHLYVADGSEVRRLGAELDRPVDNQTTGDLLVRGSRFSCEWLDAGTIVAQVADRGRTIPYRFDVASGEAAPLVEGDYVCNQIAVGGPRIVMVATHKGETTEVYALEDGSARRITENGSDWLRPFQRDPDRFLIPHPEGHEIETWVMLGRDAAQPGPAIVHIHGGPHAAHGPTPWLEMLALADAGFHVLIPNPRGSSGYGEDFARVIHGNWGELGGSDILRVVEWAVKRGLADPQRVGVMGLSHGGYLTTWLLGHYPGVFAAAVSENPVSNWVSWFGGSDLQGYTDERFVGIGRLPEDIDAFLRGSPFMQIHRNTAPLLLLQSEGDLRCPPEQSETLFTILKQRGVKTQMVRYPGEPHYLAGIGRPDRRVDRMRRIVAWFSAHM